MSWITEWGEYLPNLIDGMGLNLLITGIALIVGIPFGLLLALVTSSKSPAIRRAGIITVEIGRGAPALVVLQVLYFGLPGVGVVLSGLVCACVAFIWVTAAYTSEILRAGLQAVPRGEVEAAAALGISRADTYRFVVIPQGMRIAIPALMGFAILVFQGTSLTLTVAVPELLSQAYSIGSINFNYLSILTLAGLLFAAVSVPATWLTVWVEHRLARHQ